MNPQEYKHQLHEETKKAYAVAEKARKFGFDPSDTVEIQIAQNMAERVVGLVSVMAPQIIGSGITERIIELEKQYGTLDWRVSLQIESRDNGHTYRVKAAAQQRVRPSDRLIAEVEGLVGAGTVVIR